MRQGVICKGSHSQPLHLRNAVACGRGPCLKCQKDTLSVFAEGLSGLRQRDMSAGSTEEGHPQFTLETGDLCADHGRGDVFEVGRASEMQSFGYTQKIAELAELHVSLLVSIADAAARCSSLVFLTI
nr:hypothetical protein [Microbacterium sp. LMC-P-041]